MKKNIFLLYTVMLIGHVTIAQIVMNLQIPQVGLNLKSQLWNITITNASAVPLKVKINMVMTDLISGQQVISGSTNLIQLNQGAKTIQYADVAPVTYTVLNNNYTIDNLPSGFLPIGKFNVCYEISRVFHDEMESMAEDCSEIDVEPASPPYLNLPGDQEEIEEQRPLFTWLPPAPIYLFRNLDYSLNIVEVLKHQNSSSAIQQNLPVNSTRHIVGLTFQYPCSGALLDTGKTYAWQITANNNNVEVAKTDVWTFIIKAPSTPAVKQNTGSYFKLSNTTSPAYFICEGILKLEYINEMNDSIVSIQYYDISSQSKKMIDMESNVIQVRYGQNLIDVDLRQVKGFMSGHLYSVELINSKMENWNSKFEFRLNN